MSQSPKNRQQETPSWKNRIMLGQSQKVPKVSIQSKLSPNFQEELQFKLREIPSKQELSSRKRFSFMNSHHSNGDEKETKQNIQIHIHNDENQKPYSEDIDLSSIHLMKRAPKKIDFDVSFSPNSHHQGSKDNQEEDEQNHKANLHRPAQKSQNTLFQSSDKKRTNLESNPASHLVTSNPEVNQMLEQFFKGAKPIETSDFIKASCLYFLKQQQIDKSQQIMLEEECSAYLCTVDKKYISINALEILLKQQEHFKVFLLQKVFLVRYKQKNQHLENQYDQILEEISIQHEEFQKQSDRLKKKSAQVEKNQKAINTKFKNLRVKENQLLEKEKICKKMLTEKYENLNSKLNRERDSALKEVEKRIHNFERNARNKLELIEKRTQELKTITQKQQKQKQKGLLHGQSNDSLVRRQQTEIMSLKSKLKKTDKQYQAKIKDLEKQLKASEHESNALLKANTILQQKIEKLKSKMSSEREEQLEKQRHFEQIISEKKQKILSLQTAINELELFKQKIQKQNIENLSDIDFESGDNSYKAQKCDKMVSRKQSKHVQGSQRKSSKKHQPHKNHQGRICPSQSQIQKSDSKFRIIPVFDQFIKTLIECIRKQKSNQFNYHNVSQRYSPSSSEESITPQQLFLPFTEKLNSKITEIIFEAIDSEIYQISNLVEFSINLYLAKYSFVRFTQISGQKVKGQEGVLDYLGGSTEKTFISASKDEKTLIRIGKFTYTLKQTQSSDFYSSFLVLLLIIGLNQIISPQSEEYISIPTLLNLQILEDLSNSQQRTTSTKTFIPNHKESTSHTHNYPRKSLKLHKLQSEDYISFLLPKLLLNRSTCNDYLSTLIECCNFYGLDNEQSSIFKSMMVLQNYQYLFQVLIGAEASITQSKSQYYEYQQSLESEPPQVLENSSIILQRLCYFFGEKISQSLSSSVIQAIKASLDREQSKPKGEANFLLLSNLKSIVESIDRQE